MEIREAIEWLEGCVVSYEVDNKGRPNGYVTCDLTQEVIDMAISALEKQEIAEDEWCPGCKEYDQKNHCCHRFTKVIRETVAECKRDYANEGWIPVTERLPETTDEVLTTYINNGNRKKRYVETTTYYPDDGDGTWSSPWDEYRVADTVVEVLAWRPLPAPYQEDET